MGPYPDTRTVVGGEEAEAGMETGVGEATIMANNAGMTESETETETGTQGTEVAISQALQTPTRDTTPPTRDTIMTTTDL